MKLSEAQKLDAQGVLRRKVMTEQGWYVPTHMNRVSEPPKPELVPGIRRKPGRPRKGEI